MPGRKVNNVIFEAGIAFGMARARTIVVNTGVSMFSDLKGIHEVRLSNDINNRNAFRAKLIGIGCAVDQRTSDWTNPSVGGDFSGLSGGALPIDPFRKGE